MRVYRILYIPFSISLSVCVCVYVLKTTRNTVEGMRDKGEEEGNDRTMDDDSRGCSRNSPAIRVHINEVGGRTVRENVQWTVWIM